MRWPFSSRSRLRAVREEEMRRARRIARWQQRIGFLLGFTLSQLPGRRWRAPAAPAESQQSHDGAVSALSEEARAAARKAEASVRDALGTRDENDEERWQERRSYLIGYGLSLLLTLPVFWLAMTDQVSRVVLIWTTTAAALIQGAVHFRFFLHLRFRGQTREDLQLVLFTLVILLLMVGGTIWILENLAGRMI